MFSNKLEIEDKGEEDVMQVCIAEEVGDHGYQNREHWMRMQFEDHKFEFREPELETW